MQTLPEIKRGDTFAFISTLKDDEGNPITGKVNLLKAEVRDSFDKLVAQLEITETETDGDYLFKAQDTSGWIADTFLFTDIQYEDEGIIKSSETIRIPVIKDVTR